MEGCASKTELFGGSRQRRRGRKGGDAQNDVVLGVDLFLQIHLSSIGSDGLLGQIEIAPARDFVGEQLTAAQVQFAQDPFSQRQIKQVVGMVLNFERAVTQKTEIPDLSRIGQIDQNGNSLPRLRRKNCAQ